MLIRAGVERSLPINSSVKYRLFMLMDAKQIAYNVFINKGFMAETQMFWRHLLFSALLSD